MGEGQRERETQNLKRAPGSELSAQSPTRGLNSQNARSWPEPKSAAQPTEPPRRPKKAHSWERIKTQNNTCSIVHVPLFTLKIKRLNPWKMTTCPDVGNHCQWLNQAHTSVSPCEVVSSFSSSSSSSSSSPSPSLSFSSCLCHQYFLKGKVASSHVGYYYKLYRQLVFSISQRGESKIQYVI